MMRKQYEQGMERALADEKRKTVAPQQSVLAVRK